MMHSANYPLNPFMLEGFPLEMGPDTPEEHGFYSTGGSCPQFTRWEDWGEITVLTVADDGWKPESMDEGICYTIYLDEDSLGHGRIARQYVIRQEDEHYLVVEPPFHGGSYFITLYSPDGEKLMSGGCWTDEDAWKTLRAELARRTA